MDNKPGNNPLSPEDLIDNFINEINQEHQPKHSTEAEVSELQALALRVKGQNPEEPSQEFLASLKQKLEQVRDEQNPNALTMPQDSPKKITATTTQNQFDGSTINIMKTSPNKSTRRILNPWTGLVASFLIFILLLSPWSGSNQNIVLAMEESVKQLQNYHGILEKVSTNEAGERQVQIRTEIWSEGEKYATKTQDGTHTVNNGETRWVINSNAKEIFLLPLYLDPLDFDLQKEAAKALRYPHQVLGEETIAGRAATHIEIQPPGGLPYSLWIDQETHLPIQLQTAMQKSLQTTYTYISLETNTTLSDELFAYNPPQEYKVIDNNPDKRVATLEEALKVSGITPIEPSEVPLRIFASKNRLVLDFEDTVVIQEKATTDFDLDPTATLGQVAGGPLEILPDSLRWQQGGLEIQVQGQRAEALAKQISSTLDLTPQVEQTAPGEERVSVEINMEIVKNNQQQVDSGSSPWQLDPTQVAFTFVALKISPEGINGEPPLDFNALQLTENDGKKSVIQVSEGPVKTVYLQRLIRQDETGIWTVTGYIPR